MLTEKRPVARVRTEIVFEMMEGPSPRWVYVIFCEQTNLAKIGVADEYQKRIRDIQATSPTKLELLFAFPVESQEVETLLHQKFSKYRQHGEWFQFSPMLEADLQILQLMLRASTSSGERVSVDDIDPFTRFKLTIEALVRAIPEDADPGPYIEVLREAAKHLEASQANLISNRRDQQKNNGAYV